MDAVGVGSLAVCVLLHKTRRSNMQGPARITRTLRNKLIHFSQKKIAGILRSAGCLPVEPNTVVARSGSPNVGPASGCSVNLIHT
jgi:hypothetical protein